MRTDMGYLIFTEAYVARLPFLKSIITPNKLYDCTTTKHKGITQFHAKDNVGYDVFFDEHDLRDSDGGILYVLEDIEDYED
jgi:hypothetical protein